MVPKAGVLGLEVLAGLSAPTSMAVSMAEQLNITLIGFLRENSMSIYTHPREFFIPEPAACPPPSQMSLRRAPAGRLNTPSLARFYYVYFNIL